MVRFSLLVLLLGTAACTTVERVAAPVALSAAGKPVAAAAGQAEGARLRAIFSESDAAMLRRNPITALGRGDYSRADQLGDSYSDSYTAAERSALEQDLARLRTIDRSALNETDRLAYDVFRFGAEQELAGYSPELLALTQVRPINHFSGPHSFYPVFASGRSIAPFRNVQDYENNLARHRQFGALFDRIIARFRQGLASGVVDTKLTVRNMIREMDGLLAQPVEQSPFYAPVLNFPEAVPEADRARLRQAHLAAAREQLYPAYRRMRTFLNDEYLPRAREGAGLVHMRGGDRLYRRLIAVNTTLPLEAEPIHQLGLREVARIRTQMEQIKAQVGFTGTLAAFFEDLRTNPRFTPASREAIRDGYYAIGRRVEARIGELFSRRPRSPLEIREVESFRERTEAAGSYMDGTPDGSRPGIFYFNAYDLPARPVWGMETLYLHEGAPGHHFQIMLAAENEALPNFMRFGGNTAYVEGWALYAETLGYDMGLFEDPLQRFGTLSDEMLRAMRLVVDTGIHSKGWTREQAIKYMLDHSDMGKTDATAEVERYIAIPSQALAYKIGALTIQRLRKKAEAELGDKFDIRDFHAQVLMTGSLPLTILEAKIDKWIAEKKAG